MKDKKSVCKKVIDFILGIGKILFIILPFLIFKLIKSASKKDNNFVVTDDKIIVKDEKTRETKEVDIPENVNSDSIESVQTTKTNPETSVETVHEKEDKRNTTDIDNSAYDNLFPRK